MSDNSRIGFGQPVLLNRIAEADRNNDGDQYESDLDLPFWVKAEIGAAPLPPDNDTVGPQQSPFRPARYSYYVKSILRRFGFKHLNWRETKRAWTKAGLPPKDFERGNIRDLVKAIEAKIALEDRLRDDISCPTPTLRKLAGRGRRPNQKRRDAIHNVITQHGDEWRDHLGDIFKELDSKVVPLGGFLGRKIDLGGGASPRVTKWDDLDLSQGEQRNKIIDVIRKYVD